MMNVLNNPQRLAKLLASLNVSGTERPLSPVEVASEINAVRDDLNGDLKEVVRRLPVSLDIVKEFLYLMKLPPEIQDVVSWGESRKGDGTIGFSTAAKVARLKDNEDILKLAGTILDMSRPVTKEEVKEVLSLKRRIPKKSIDECIMEVLNVTRHTTIHHFLFICRIKPNVVELLSRSDHSHGDQDKMLSILKGKFPSETLKSVKVSDDRIRLVLEKEGWEFISTYVERHGLLRQDVISHMIETGGFRNE